MSCLTPEQIDLLARGALDAGTGASLRAHLQECESCRRKLEQACQGEEFLGQIKDLPDNTTLPNRERQLIAAADREAAELTGRGPADGSPASPPRTPDYELIRHIGKGGFGEVWLARQRLTGAFCAVKVIPRDRIGAIELEGVRQYKQRTAGHPRLMNIEHVGETEQCYYYVMELADDARGSGLHEPADYQPMTLAEYLQRKGRLPIDEAVRITCDLLEALEHIHEAGLLHRDVKPANVMLQGGRWKLGDLGLVTPHDQTQNLARTPAYSPPEGVCDRSGDLFCLGRVLHNLVTGRGSEPSSETKPSAGWPRPLDRRLQGLIARACDPNSANRFQTTAEMRAALQPHSEPPFVKAISPRRRAGAFAALFLIAAAASVIWWFRGNTEHPAGPQGSPPRIEVHFKRPAEKLSYESGYEVLSEASVPLLTGSLIQVHADLERPAYPYLLWVNASEPPVLLHPREGESPKLVSEFWSPSLAAEGQEQKWHRLKPPAGTEMLLLLVADAPVGNFDQLVSQLQDLRCPEINKFTMLEGDPETPLLRWNRARGLEPGAAEAPKGLLRTVPGDWRSRFRSVRILAFAHEANATTSVGAQP